MIHNHCKIRKEHYWGVGKSTKPTIEDAVAAGIPRRSAVQRLRHCHDAVLLLAGDESEQVTISLTPKEVRWLAEDLLARAKEIEDRSPGRKKA